MKNYNSKLKIFLLVGVLIGFLAIFGYFQAGGRESFSGQKVQGPKIVVEPASFDFGEVRRPKAVEQEFLVRNTGSEILEIRRVSTSCGCTTAWVIEPTIAPGGQTILKVRYDSGAMAHEKGEIERIVYLKSNDPQNPQLEVKIYANVK